MVHDDEYLTRPMFIVGAMVMCLAIGTCLMGCMSPGREIKTAAGQNTFAKFDADGNLEISGDGTADFDVQAEGNDDGWKLTIKTKTSRESISGTAQMTTEMNRTLRSAFDLARAAMPGNATTSDTPEP